MRRLKRLIRNTRGKKGVSLAPFTLVELILGALVLAAVWLTLFSITSGASFYQMFFAKDNAYIAETLHAVPNGEVHFGYLWPNTDYHIDLARDTVSVSLVKEGLFLKSNKRTKAFGASASAVVEPNSFAPRTFEWVLSSQDIREIKVDQTFFSTSACPSSSQPLNGITVSGGEKGFEAGTAQKRIEAAFENVLGALQAKGAGSFGNVGPSIRLYAVKIPSGTITNVYSTSTDDQVKYLSCLIGQSSGVTVLPISENTFDSGNADIIIVMQTDETVRIDTINGILRNAVLAYKVGDAK